LAARFGVAAFFCLAGLPISSIEFVHTCSAPLRPCVIQTLLGGSSPSSEWSVEVFCEACNGSLTLAILSSASLRCRLPPPNSSLHKPSQDSTVSCALEGHWTVRFQRAKRLLRLVLHFKGGGRLLQATIEFMDQGVYALK